MDWGGAQWVMACYLALRAIAPPVARGAGLSAPGKPPKPFAEWLGGYLAILLGLAFLVAILRWGGFF